MSVLIEGMEMPTGCGALTLMVWPDGQVEIIDTDGEWKTSKAISVPTHGRLKDYDRIMKEYDEWFSKTESRGYENMFYALRMAINSSPTIIPAEEK